MNVKCYLLSLLFAIVFDFFGDIFLIFHSEICILLIDVNHKKFSYYGLS